MKSSTLIVTAHPDDETIFFGGLLISRPKSDTHVICVTDGNADGLGEQRAKDFHSALEDLQVTGEMLSHPDKYEQRLDIEALIETLNNYSADEVYTHNALGEYGHPHHQDVCFAVHNSFHERARIFSTAYNNFPCKRVELSASMWEQKLKVFSKQYWSETKRFFQFIPCTWAEGFAEVPLDEVTAIYSALTKSSVLDQSALDHFQFMAPYIEQWLSENSERPF